MILGGGFAGVRAALDLHNYLHDSVDVEIILVDRHDYHTYHAGLYEAATAQHSQVKASKVKRTVAIPFADIFAKTKVKAFKAFIERVDFANNEVVTDSRVLPFDYLVVAMGSMPDFYDIPNLDKYGFTLHTMEDAIMLRNRVEDLVVKKESGQVVIGGGGFAGVELAGELCNLLKHECAAHGRSVENYKVIIVEGSTGFLPGLSQKVSAIVDQRLSQMMIDTRFSALITDTDKDHVVLNMKERLDYDLLVWTGGVKSAKMPSEETFEQDKKGRMIVSGFLSLQKYPHVFLAGDNTCFVDPSTKKAVPPTATEAIRQGDVVAKNISRSFKGKPLLPYIPRAIRFIIPVSGKYAIYYTPNLIITGKLGWLIRRFADLRYFMSILPWTTAFKYWLFENRIFIKND